VEIGNDLSASVFSRRVFGSLVTADLELVGFAPRPIGANSPSDIRIVRGSAEPPSATRPLVAGDWPLVERHGHRLCMWFPGELVARASRDGLVEYWQLRPLDRETFSYDLLDAVAPRVLAFAGRHVLHGGSVAGSEGAVVFLGVSGAGKSTLTAALARHGYDLIGDDVAALTPSARQQFNVEPALASIRLREDSAAAVLGSEIAMAPKMADWSAKRVVAARDNRLEVVTGPIPLQSVVLLAEHEAAPTLDAVTGAEAFMLLREHSFDPPTAGPTAGIDLLDRWGPVADSCKFWRLRRHKSFESLPDIVNVLQPLIGSPLRTK